MSANRRSDDKSSLKYRLLASGGSLTKYHSKYTPCNHGHTHQSLKEAARCNELHLLLKGGYIKDLVNQPKFILQPQFIYNGHSITALTYRADFSYLDLRTKKIIIEDVKGYKTNIYKLKKKLMLYSLKNSRDTAFIES